ncbi:MAG TPA: 30S ribosomal protein S4 [Phycisphaerae bacterium]|nr:30S ribosomal protein S4 [Phycisphaerae bacterium]
MGTYHGPKVRLSRSLGVPIAETPKHMRLRRENPPGMHGAGKGRRKSLYGERLRAKQRLARYYNVRDGQMRRYMEEASKSKRTTPVVLHEILETRLDNVVRRLGWARTIWQARQMVSHGHFLVDGQKVNIASFRVGAGQKVSLKEKSAKCVKAISETAEFHLQLDWLQRDDAKFEATVARMPALEDSRIPFDVDYNLIVEYYSR